MAEMEGYMDARQAQRGLPMARHIRMCSGVFKLEA